MLLLTQYVMVVFGETVWSIYVCLFCLGFFWHGVYWNCDHWYRKWISVSKMIKPIKKGIVYLSKTSVLLELLGNLLGEHLEKPSFYICIESGMSLLAVFLYPLSPQTFFTCFASHRLIYFSGQSPARFNRTRVFFPHFSTYLP